MCPPPSLQGASRCSNRVAMLQHIRTTVTTMTEDKTIVDALARYTGTVTRCPAGRASAPDAKERGRAQFRCLRPCWDDALSDAVQAAAAGAAARGRYGFGASDVARCCAERRRETPSEPLRVCRPVITGGTEKVPLEAMLRHASRMAETMFETVRSQPSGTPGMARRTRKSPSLYSAGRTDSCSH